MDLSLTIKEYAFTSPFPMQRNPPQIVKWHPGASTQLGHDMHWGLLMCQYGTIQRNMFFCFSQYTLKRSLIFKAALHVLPRQNQPNTNLNRGKNENSPSIEPCGTPPPAQSTKQLPLPPFRQSHQGKIFQEASVHLRKCLSLAGLDMTIKRRRGRNFGLSCLTLFLLSLDVPTTP